MFPRVNDVLPECFCDDVTALIISKLPPADAFQLMRVMPVVQYHKLHRYCVGVNPNEWYEFAMREVAAIDEEDFYRCLSPRVTHVLIDRSKFPPRYNPARYIAWLKTLQLAHVDAYDWVYPRLNNSRESTRVHQEVKAELSLRATHVAVHTTQYVIECGSIDVHAPFVTLPRGAKRVNVLSCLTNLGDCKPQIVTQQSYNTSLITEELAQITVRTGDIGGMAAFLRHIERVAPECEVTIVANKYDAIAETSLRLKTNLPITGPRVVRTNEPCERVPDQNLFPIGGYNILRISGGSLGFPVM